MQAVFRLSDSGNSASKVASDEIEVQIEPCAEEIIGPHISEKTMKLTAEDAEIDMSEGIAFDMFAVSPSNDNEVKGSLSPTTSMIFTLHFLFYVANQSLGFKHSLIFLVEMSNCSEVPLASFKTVLRYKVM